ncbi:MAG: stage 0 sporulation protein [Desulfomicrobiaceae bacterium]|jgi:ParB family chromosome partitioning protein|nr:stage 0 sporulation protein [Desulfomicrobiaceae bacterium]
MTGSTRGLGRGLDALLGSTSSEPQEGLQEIPLNQLRPSPYQPRQHFDPAGLEELAASIAAQGVIQPLTVRPMDDGSYEIVAGERRFRACQMAGLCTAPCLVRKMSDTEAMAVALVENLQREDLSPMEEARALEALRATLNLTQEDLADQVGKSRPAVANALRLLKLPASVQDMVEDGRLSAGHARALLPLETEELIHAAAQEVVRRGLTVRQTEALVKRFPPTPPQPKTLPADMAAWHQRMAERIPCPIQVRGDEKRGQVVFSYRNPRERALLLALMGGLEMPQ